jgi:hypothetical protein
MAPLRAPPATRWPGLPGSSIRLSPLSNRARPGSPIAMSPWRAGTGRCCESTVSVRSPTIPCRCCCVLIRTAKTCCRGGLDGVHAFRSSTRIMRQPTPVSFSTLTGWEAPDPNWWVVQGYAVVNCDLRGAGTSDGVGRDSPTPLSQTSRLE